MPSSSFPMSLAAGFFPSSSVIIPPQLCSQSRRNFFCSTYLWEVANFSVRSLYNSARYNWIRKQPRQTCQWFYVSIKGSWSLLWLMMAMQGSHVIGIYKKRWLSAQGCSSVIRLVTVTVSLLLSLSTCTSYTHQSHMPAVRCSNECPTFLLLKFDDVLLKSFFPFSTSFFFIFLFLNFNWFRVIWGCYDTIMTHWGCFWKAILLMWITSSWTKHRNVSDWTF